MSDRGPADGWGGRQEGAGRPAGEDTADGPAVTSLHDHAPRVTSVKSHVPYKSRPSKVAPSQRSRPSADLLRKRQVGAAEDAAPGSTGDVAEKRYTGAVS